MDVYIGLRWRDRTFFVTSMAGTALHSEGGRSIIMGYEPSWKRHGFVEAFVEATGVLVTFSSFIRCEP